MYKPRLQAGASTRRPPIIRSRRIEGISVAAVTMVLPERLAKSVAPADTRPAQSSYALFLGLSRIKPRPRPLSVLRPGSGEPGLQRGGKRGFHSGAEVGERAQQHEGVE